MDQETIISALVLGIVEGLTEFIPVSSTGHILLLGHFLGFENTGKIFEVLIQLGAILAILTLYFYRLWNVAMTLPTSAKSRQFVIGVLIAFMPAVVIGLMAHEIIKTVLFESPMLICVMLIIGGFILLWVDKKASKMTPKYTNAMEYPLWLCLVIGLFQCVAMIPGVSRSGATIAGSLLMGTDKRSAAEFTFFLAMPTMAGAFVYDLYKNIDLVSMDDLVLVAIGFAAAFVMAVVVVKYLLDFVSKHGFAPFAYWRILVGAVGMVGLFLYTPAPSENNVAAFTSSAEAHTTDVAVEKVSEEAETLQRLVPDASSDTTFEHSLTIESNSNTATTRVAKPKRPDDWKVGIKEDRWPLELN